MARQENRQELCATLERLERVNHAHELSQLASKRQKSLAVLRARRRAVNTNYVEMSNGATNRRPLTRPKRV
jgi:hypothetical protein